MLTRWARIAFVVATPLLPLLVPLADAQSIVTVAGGGSDDGRPATAAFVYASDITVDSRGNLLVADSRRVRYVNTETGFISTIAGNGLEPGYNAMIDYSGDGGPATDAALDAEAVITDATGRIYIAGGDRIRRILPDTGVISTFAALGQSKRGDARLNDVQVDSSGNVYASVTYWTAYVCRIIRFDALTGTRADYAGGTCSVGGTAIGDGGQSTEASFGELATLAMDSAGNLLVADGSNQRIRRIDAASGVITSVGGNGTAGFFGDGGPATQASLEGPRGVAVDSGGDIYIADSGNNRVRRVDGRTGIITTVAGNGERSLGGDGGPATLASIIADRVALDADGNLFVAGDFHIRRIDAVTGTISTVAGTGVPYTGDGGPSTAASLHNPSGVAFNDEGDLFVVETHMHRVRRVNRATGVITTVAGNGAPGFAGDGGPATAASLWSPEGVALDASGSLYVADTGNRRIRRVDGTTGIVTTFAGNGQSVFAGDGGPATDAALTNPRHVAVGGDGVVYLDDGTRVRGVKIATGIIGTVAGPGVSGVLGDGGPATQAYLSNPQGLVVDDTGDLYIASLSGATGNGGLIRRVDSSSGIITTVAGGGLGSGDGQPATASLLLGPRAVAADRDGNLYVADWADANCHACPIDSLIPAHGFRIRRVDAVTGLMRTVAGNGAGGFSGDGFDAIDARLTAPEGLTIDEYGKLYIADTENDRVRKVTLCGPVDAPGLVAPADGASELANPVRLSWMPAGGVSRYRVFYDTVNPPTLETSPCIGTDACFTETTSFTLPALRPHTTYYWMVYSTRDPGCPQVAGSEVRSFTTASTVRQHPVRHGD